jgi:hemoglobin
MRRIRWWLASPLAAALAAWVLAGGGRAQDVRNGLDSGKAVDAMLYTNLRDIINRGAYLYNGGDWAGCYRVFEGALMATRPLLQTRPHLQKAIDDGLARAEQRPLVWQRAWALREVIDQIRTEINPNPQAKKPAEEKKPVEERKSTEAKKPADEKKPDRKPPAETRLPDLKRPPEEKKPVERKPPPDRMPPPVSTNPSPEKTTLWQRLGGEQGVRQVVHDIVDAVAKDPKVDFFRGGKYQLDRAGAQRLERELVEQVSSLTGGPLKYAGLSMRDAHKGMHITAAQYDAFMGHVRDVLDKYKVGAADVETIMTALNGYRKEVIEEPKAPQDKKSDKGAPDKK